MTMRIYENYGDVNFFEYGRLVEVYINDDGTIDDRLPVYNVLYCEPIYDDEKYLFSPCTVDIYDTWIDVDAVERFGGVRRADSPLYFALACIDYYGIENFSDYYNYFPLIVGTDEICDTLKHIYHNSDTVIFSDVF